MYTKNNPTTSIDGKAAHCPTCGSYCNAATDLDDMDYCNDCRPQTKETILAEILEKFENGQNRYDNDPNFRIFIEALAQGIGVYAVLDSALKALKSAHNINAKMSEEIQKLKDEVLKLRAYIDDDEDIVIA